jgi:hypothetical protein
MDSKMLSRLMSRFVRPDDPDLTPEMARHIVSFQLSEEERAHLSELAEKCNQCETTPEELVEYEVLVQFGEFLTLMKAKAHLFLKTHSTAA